MSIKTKVLNISKKHKWFGDIAKRANIMLKKIKYMKYYIKNKVDDNLIVFVVFNGRSYCDSPKSMYLEMQKDQKFNNYKFAWVFINPDEKQHYFNGHNNVELIKYASKEYFEVFSKAKYWIVNSIVPLEIKKKKSQVYCQTWHGTPLKRLRCDIEVDGTLSTKRGIKRSNDLDAKRFDYFLSPSPIASEKFKSAFNLTGLGIEDIIIEEGYPRNDELFSYTKEDVEKLKKQLNIPMNKKVILYAPTFRDNQHNSGIGYTYDPKIDFDKLKKEFGNEFIILFRAHYFVANAFDFSKYEGFIFNVSNIPEDSNHLFIISDILITDYSSVFFDYANLKKPMIFYMYDLDEYKNKLRNFYFDLSVLPGPIVEKEENLYNEIKNIKNHAEKYKNQYKEFNDIFNCLDGPSCSKKVINRIFKGEE